MKPALPIAGIYANFGLGMAASRSRVYCACGANNTSSVSMLNYSNLFTGFNFGIGSAMSVLILICVAIIAVLFIRGFGTAAPGSSLQQ